MENRQTDSDQLAAVGVELKAARHAAGFSLDDVSARLCISIRYLKAIEAGNRVQIPGTTYMLGFVRSYAKLLNLDADALCQRIIDSMPMDALRPEYQAIGGGVETQDYRMRYIVGAVVVVILLYSGWYLYRNNFIPLSNPLPDEVSFGSDNQDVPEAILPESVMVVDDIAPAPAPVVPAFVLKATADNWVETGTATGEIVIARLLVRDEMLAVASDAVLTTSNAWGLLVGHEASWQALGSDSEILPTKTIDSLFLP